MRVTGKTDIGKRRGENQDSYRLGYLPNGFGWGIVCDGMGGGQDGRLASTLAVESVEKRLRKGLMKCPQEDKVTGLIIDAIRRANHEIYLVSGSGSVTMGTTIVCAVVKDDKLFLAHVGDSRCYIYKNDNLRQLTKDHSMVQELIDNGVLTEQQANAHPEKNVITRALGVEKDVKVETAHHKIDTESVIMLCTDGLSNMVSSITMKQVMAENDFYDMANKLVESALQAGGYDNITVALMQNHRFKSTGEV